MTTLGGLRESIRQVMGDESAWPDYRLNQWIRDALQDYSLYFPLTASTAISCAAGERVYALPASTLGVSRVEYPQGKEPPRFLTRCERGSPQFAGGPTYDLLGEPPEQILLGEEPAAGESIGIEVTTLQSSPGGDASALTLPDNHLSAVRLFVQWQAVKELELRESLDPNEKSLLLSSFGLNAVRAERLYRQKLREFQAQAAWSGRAGPWRMDGHDRVY